MATSLLDMEMLRSILGNVAKSRGWTDASVADIIEKSEALDGWLSGPDEGSDEWTRAVAAIVAASGQPSAGKVAGDLLAMVGTGDSAKERDRVQSVYGQASGAAALTVQDVAAAAGAAKDEARKSWRRYAIAGAAAAGLGLAAAVYVRSR